MMILDARHTVHTIRVAAVSAAAKASSGTSTHVMATWMARARIVSGRGLVVGAVGVDPVDECAVGASSGPAPRPARAVAQGVPFGRFAGRENMNGGHNGSLAVRDEAPQPGGVVVGPVRGGAPRGYPCQVSQAWRVLVASAHVAAALLAELGEVDGLGGGAVRVVGVWFGSGGDGCDGLPKRVVPPDPAGAEECAVVGPGQ